MKTLLAILGVLIVVAGIVFTTQFVSRSSHAQDAYLAYPQNVPQVYSPQPSFHADIQSAPQSQLVPNFKPPVNRAITPTRDFNSFGAPNQVSTQVQPVARKPAINHSNRFASQDAGTFAKSPSPGFNHQPAIATVKTRIVAPQKSPQQFNPIPHARAANFQSSGFTAPVSTNASSWPQNAKNVKNLVRTHYSLPSGAAESIVEFFAADNNENIETRISTEEGSVLVSLIVTSDEKTQRAVAAFLDAVYPASRIKEIITADEAGNTNEVLEGEAEVSELAPDHGTWTVEEDAPSQIVSPDLNATLDAMDDLIKSANQIERAIKNQ